jgi:hypothetical protein
VRSGVLLFQVILVGTSLNTPFALNASTLCS